MFWVRRSSFSHKFLRQHHIYIKLRHNSKNRLNFGGGLHSPSTSGVFTFSIGIHSAWSCVSGHLTNISPFQFQRGVINAGRPNCLWPCYDLYNQTELANESCIPLRWAAQTLIIFSPPRVYELGLTNIRNISRYNSVQFNRQFTATEMTNEINKICPTDSTTVETFYSIIRHYYYYYPRL